MSPSDCPDWDHHPTAALCETCGFTNPVQIRWLQNQANESFKQQQELYRQLAEAKERERQLREALTRIKGPGYGFMPTMQEMVQIATAALVKK